MQLQFLNEYTSHNLGDAAIYETLVQLAAPHQTLSSLDQHSRRHVRGVQAAQHALEGDCFVSVGGDIFNNARPRLLTRRFLQNLRILRAPPPRHSFVFGQGIPSSCQGLSMRLLAGAMRRLSSVTVRDADSHARLRARGVDARLSFDTVFAYQPRAGCAEAGRALLAQANLDPQRAVLLSVRGFDAMYPHDNALFVSRMARLAQRLHERGHQVAAVIQANAQGADSDLGVVQELRRQCATLSVLDPFALSAGHHPLDALIGALGQVNAVVAVRYHTAILRLLSGRQVYSLHYSNKGQDLADRLGLPGTPLADFDPDQAVHGVERSAGQLHDFSAQRSHVRDSFAAALTAASVGVAAKPAVARVCNPVTPA